MLSKNDVQREFGRHRESLVAPKKVSVTPLPKDNYLSVVKDIFPIGNTISEREYEDKITNKKYKKFVLVPTLLFIFQIDARIDNPESEYHGKRYEANKWITFIISKENSSNLSNLTKLIQACKKIDVVPDDYDVNQLIGDNIMLDTFPGEKGYAKIKFFSAVPSFVKTRMEIEDPFDDVPEWVLGIKNKNDIAEQEFLLSQKKSVPKTDAESLANSQPPADDNDDFQSSSKAMADAKGSSTEEAMAGYYERVDAESPF